MKLVSIINVWADCLCLLPYCIENHLQFCDSVIVVWSAFSNHGVKDDRMLEFVVRNNWKDLIGCYAPENPGKYQNVLFQQCEPVKGLKPLVNETRKRNAGIDYAKSQGFTHFFLADADEFYKPEEVQEVKKLFTDPHLNGVVCPLVVYVGKPTLWCEDHTLVSFIHKLNKNTQAGNFKNYPYAYNGKHAHIDPSRRLNETLGVVMCNATMHHFSYLRKDIDLKINNSSAKLSRSEAIIKRDIANAKPGYFSELYSKHLKESENFFEIHV